MPSLKSTCRSRPRIPRPWILIVAILVVSAFTLPVAAQPTGHEPWLQNRRLSPKEESSQARFTGSLTVRQKNGSLYYKIYVLRGTVIGGYDTWRGSSTHYHRIVGGWYDGDRMVLLIQSTQDDLGDKWYSHSHHFEKKDDQLVITHSLYGFGKTIDSGEVYRPHTIDDISELSAEEVQRLAGSAEREASPPATQDSDRAASTKQIKQLKQENARLKQLVVEFLLENRRLEDKLRDD